MNAFEAALNAVYKVKESRPLWETYGIVLILTGFGIAALTLFFTAAHSFSWFPIPSV